jgi:hypothetical protein
MKFSHEIRKDLVFAVITIVLVPLLAGCSSNSSSSDQYPSKEYELLTILGDVQDRPDEDPGRWRPVRDGAPLGQMSEEERAKLSEMMALPYVQGSTEAPGVENVTKWETDLAWNGLNVYTSGHAPEAYVMDMQGRVLHKWEIEVEDVWPAVPRTIHSTFFRRVNAFPNGDLLVIFEGIGLIKIDRYSNVLWAYRGGCHHQTFVAADGNIYVLTRRAQIVERINAERPIVPDAIAILSPDGKLISEVPLLEAFEKTKFKRLLELIKPRGDIFHTNSIHVFDGSLENFSPLFKKGNVLTSLLVIDTIAIVDMDKGEIAWAITGRGNDLWKKQHDPTPLPNGNILLFDNRGYRKKSRVLEFSPRNRRVVWQYAGTPENPLWSRTCGTSRRMPNGNIVITESDNGRALEITREQKLVWEFYNPHRAGQDNELIATLFELERVPADYFPWIESD